MSADNEGAGEWTEYMQGTLIVIEGTDGSGKRTQVELLTNRLRQDGYDVAAFSFPRYDEPSSYFVREYLNGAYGDKASDIGPYTASLFYALDRFAAAAELRDALNTGKIVIVDRYVGSNMAHQGTKFQHAAERRGFFIWLDNLEFELLRIPRPTISLVLRVPIEVASQLLGKKGPRTYTSKKLDLHEADTGHLKQSLEVFDDMCQLFPKDFSSIDCTRDGQLLPLETIQEIIRHKVEPYLPEKPLTLPQTSTQAELSVPEPASITAEAEAAAPPNDDAAEEPSPVDPPYIVPESLTDPLKQQYRSHLDRILELHQELVDKLTAHLQATGTAEAATQAEAIAQAVLPLATRLKNPTDHLHRIVSSVLKHSVRTLGEQYLSETHTTQAIPSIQLVEVQPRNELDALPDVLYPYATQPLRELRRLSSGWNYEEKSALLETYAKEQPEALSAIQYTWDIVSNARTLAAFAERLESGLNCQELSPRYGYAVPEVLDQAGLADQFEACFDISLGLCSILQEAGHHTEAQSAILLGHIVRWKAVIRANDFAHLCADVPGNPLLSAMRDQLSEKHPLITNALDK